MRPNSTRQPMTLRALRLWHWRKVLLYRAKAVAAEAATARWEAINTGYTCRAQRNLARTSHTQANWHLGAVQVLNDVLPDTTAEQDAAEQKRVRKKMDGCGAALAPGQWWVRCGESDMGQTAPILCNVCDPKDGLKRAPQA